MKDMSMPMRFLLGDMKREGKVKVDNKFGVEVRIRKRENQSSIRRHPLTPLVVPRSPQTLPDSYDMEIGTLGLSNGYLIDKKLDQQAMILLSKKTDTVILCFRGTDAGAGAKSAVLDLATTMVGNHPFKTSDDSITTKGKVHIGMQKSWKRLKQVIVPTIRKLFQEGEGFGR